MYIARDGASLQPTTCHSDDTKVTIVEGVAEAMVSLPPALPLQQVQQQNWIPRSFGFGSTGFFQNASAMKQNVERYLEGYELAGF
jgi:hypothetical protein